MTIDDIILDNLPAILATLISMVPTVWLVVQKIIQQKQARADKKLDFEHSEKISSFRKNFEIIEGRVAECYKARMSKLDCEEEICKILDQYKMNGISQTEYIRHANWQYDVLVSIDVAQKEYNNIPDQYKIPKYKE